MRRILFDADHLLAESSLHLVGNIAAHLRGAQKRIQLRQTAIFYSADPDSGRRVAESTGLDVSEVERLAKMTQEERTTATAP